MKDAHGSGSFGPVYLAAVLSAVVFLFAGCDEEMPVVDMKDSSSVQSRAVKDESMQVLRVAVGAMISPETTRIYYDDLLKLLGEKAGRTVEIVQRKTYAEVNELLENRSVDVAFICSGPYVELHDRMTLEILAVPVVNGEKFYYSYLIAHHDSEYSSFSDIEGAKFAFTDPDSNTGCLVPTYMLEKLGYSPEEYFSEIVYTHAHDNSVKAVAKNTVDAASVDSLVWEYQSVVEPEVTSQTRIVDKSPPYGIPPVVVHPDLNDKLKTILRETMFSFHKDERGIEILKELHIERFEEGSDSDYDSIREMKEWIALEKTGKKNEALLEAVYQAYFH